MTQGTSTLVAIGRGGTGLLASAFSFFVGDVTSIEQNVRIIAAVIGLVVAAAMAVERSIAAWRAWRDRHLHSRELVDDRQKESQ